MADPLYYLIQLILFPLAAVIFGYFLNALMLEIATSGWVLSPRCVWRLCLTVSSFFFCVLELDPCSVLGILPTAWRIGVESVIVSVLLNSASSTFFMYIIVLSKRHLSKAAPSLITNPNLWVVSNLIITIAIFLFALVGAITNSTLWFGLALIVVGIQELILLVVVNVTLHKMGSLLKELEGQLKLNYTTQRRKLWIIRIVTTVILVFNIVNQFTKSDSFAKGLVNPAAPSGYDPEVFPPSAPLSSVLMALGHLLLLYAMHRPSDSSRAATVVVLTGSSVEQRPSKHSVTTHHHHTHTHRTSAPVPPSTVARAAAVEGDGGASVV